MSVFFWNREHFTYDFGKCLRGICETTYREYLRRPTTSERGGRNVAGSIYLRSGDLFVSGIGKFPLYISHRAQLRFVSGALKGDDAIYLGTQAIEVQNGDFAVYNLTLMVARGDQHYCDGARNKETCKRFPNRKRTGDFAIGVGGSNVGRADYDAGRYLRRVCGSANFRQH